MPVDHANLTTAKANNADEFYTTYDVVAAELELHAAEFAGAHVVCPCNDGPSSAFTRFILDHMRDWHVMRLTSFTYDPTYGTLFETGRGARFDVVNDGRTSKYTTADLVRTELDGSGSFDSREVLDVMRGETVIVVTNMPFSQGARFLPLLDRLDVRYCVLGELNMIKYTSVFPMILAGRCRLGASIRSGDRPFHVPDDYPLTAVNGGVDKEGRRYVRVKGVRWFTNMTVTDTRSAKNLTGNMFTPDRYPMIDSYDAISVDSVNDIPGTGWDGNMAVPITTIDWIGNTIPQLRLVGELNHGNDPRYDYAKPVMNGRELFPRLVVRAER